MSIHIAHAKDCKVIVIDTPESFDRFKELVRRATNVWDFAHPEIKEFADLIDHGKVLQDYYAQAGMPRKPGP